jgi:gag-polypeptide of LTR copia-type
MAKKTIIKEVSNVNTSLKLTTMQFNGTNYQCWAKTTTISLRCKGRLSYIGSISKLVTPVEAEE